MSCISPREDKDAFLRATMENIEQRLLSVADGQARLEDCFAHMTSNLRHALESINEKLATRAAPELVNGQGGLVKLGDVRPEVDLDQAVTQTTTQATPTNSENGCVADANNLLVSIEGRASPDKMGMTASVEATPSSPLKQGRAQVMKSKHLPALQQIINDDEATEFQKKMTEQEFIERQTSGLFKRLFGGHRAKKAVETTIDIFVALVILANSCFLGFQLDAERKKSGWDRWRSGEIVFSALFWLELAIRLKQHGRSHFCGHGWLAHAFDAALIVVDTLQLVIEIASDGGNSGMPSASLFRMLRLARVTRLLRMIPTSLFQDLLKMVQGIGIGMMTLFWAVVVFFLLVYVMSLLCRNVFGQDDVTDEERHAIVHEYFDTVPRSMLTVFRCSFGDCSDLSGTPIAEHITHGFGGFFGFMYCLFTFFMTVGFFNVISAIFVDSTMAAAAAIDKKNMQARLEDNHRWCGNVSTIIKRLVALSPDHHMQDAKLSSCIDSLLLHPIQTTCISEAVNDSETRKALSELDIDADDHKKLVDILDPDHNGTVGVLELVSGLGRLRGQPRRSDIVTVDLMVRALQETVDNVLREVVEVRQAQDEIQKRRQFRM